MSAQPARKGSKVRGALIAAILLVGGALAASSWFYFNVMRPPPTAARHVPETANVALRADGAKLLLFKPVRQHLWPIFLGPATDAEPSPRRQAIKKATGVDIPGDLREVVIASTGPIDWVLLLGGAIEPGRFVPGLASVLEAEGTTFWSLEDGLLVHSLGPAIGQAEDGTIVIGTSEAITRLSLPARDTRHDLPLPRQGALSFALKRQALQALLALLPSGLPGSTPLHQVDHLSGTISLSETPQLTLRISPRKGVEAAALSDDIEGHFARLKLATLLIPGDLYGAKSALGDVVVSERGNVVQLATNWPYEPIDEAIKLLADSLRTGMAVIGERPSQ